MQYTLKFIIRKDRPDRNNFCPIYLRYSINRKYSNIPVGHSVLSTLWDDDSGKLTYKDKSIEKAMHDVEQKVKSIIYKFNEQWEINPSIEEFNQFIKIDKASGNLSQITIEQAFHNFLESKKHLTVSTKTVLNTCYAGLIESLEYNKRPVRWSSIDDKFSINIKDYFVYKKFSKNTVGKYVKHIKAFLNFCVKNYQLIRPEHFTSLKIESETPDVLVLTSRELELLKSHITYSLYFKQKIMNGDEYVLTEREHLIGRIFLFLCSTGLRYSDFLALTLSNFIYEEDIDGSPKLYLRLSPIKTKGSLITIPLLDDALDILFLQSNIPVMVGHFIFWDPNDITVKMKSLKQFVIDYKHTKPTGDGGIAFFPDYPKLFPKITNQEFNEEIKKVCEKVGINNPVMIRRSVAGKVVSKTSPKHKLITSHTGRKTFVSESLNKGISHELIRAVTGHSDYRSMKPYIKISSNAVVNEFIKKATAAKPDPATIEKKKSKSKTDRLIQKHLNSGKNNPYNPNGIL